MNAPIDITGVVLTTPRLVLRPWRESDLNDLFEYARVDGVGQMAGWTPHKSIDESREILEMFMREKRTFALEFEGKVVGSLGRRHPLAVRRCEAGFHHRGPLHQQRPLPPGDRKVRLPLCQGHPRPKPMRQDGGFEGVYTVQIREGVAFTSPAVWLEPRA